MAHGRGHLCPSDNKAELGEDAHQHLALRASLKYNRKDEIGRFLFSCEEVFEPFASPVCRASPDRGPEEPLPMKFALSVLPLFLHSFPTPHLGLACLAAYLKSRGFRPRIIDLRHERSPYALELYYSQPNAQRQFVSEIMEYPLLASVLKRYLKGRDAEEMLRVREDDPMLQEWALERTLLPEEVAANLRRAHLLLRRSLRLFRDYEVVGFSLYHTNLYLTAVLAALLRRENPSTLLFFGGPQVTQSALTRELLLETGLAHGLVVGEGEGTMAELLGRLRAGLSWEDIPGLLTQKNRNGEEPCESPPVRDLDELLVPDFEEFSLGRFVPFTLPLYASRGCPYRCSFCSERDLLGPYRRRSPGRVVEDMRALGRRFRTRLFIFADSMLNGSPKWLEEFADRLTRERGGFLWGGNFKARLDGATVRKLKRAALNHAEMGVESFADYTLELMNKRQTSSESLATLERLLKSGISVKLNIITGFPSESARDFSATLSACRELRRQFCGRDGRASLYIQVQPFQLRPSSAMYRDPERFGLGVEGWRGPRGLPLDSRLKRLGERLPYTFTVKGLDPAESHHRYELLHKVSRGTDYPGRFRRALEKVVRESLKGTDRVRLAPEGNFRCEVQPEGGDRVRLMHRKDFMGFSLTLDALGKKMVQELGREREVGELLRELKGQFPGRGEEEMKGILSRLAALNFVKITCSKS